MLLIDDIAMLAAVPPGPLRGARMREIPLLRNAAILVDTGRIYWFGSRAELPAADITERISAAGGCVIPGLIDCHTHIPFAGDRAAEFVRRVAGESYLSIMQAGGGIRVTSAAVRAAGVEQLVRENLPRLERMRSNGVTTVECKSGYGLSREAEINQLRATHALAAAQPLELVATYMGAHALPAEYEERPDAFLDDVADEAFLSQLSRERLAEFCDVFCDRGAFDTRQARRVLERAVRAGLRPKLHADELAQIGASQLAGELRAVSADHLELIDPAGMAALRDGDVIAVALPGTSFFLGIEHCPARAMIDAGLAVAIATDFNPGSCHIESLPFVMNIACCQLRLRPLEVLAACTANAAAAIARADRLGAIAVGYAADLAILAAPDLDHWFYSPGRNLVRCTIKAGRAIHRADA